MLKKGKMLRTGFVKGNWNANEKKSNWQSQLVWNTITIRILSFKNQLQLQCNESEGNQQYVEMRSYISSTNI